MSGAIMRAHTASDVVTVVAAVEKVYAEESTDVCCGGRVGGEGVVAVRLRGRGAEGATVTASATAPDVRRRHSALPQASRDELFLMVFYANKMFFQEDVGIPSSPSPPPPLPHFLFFAHPDDHSPLVGTPSHLPNSFPTLSAL